LILVCPLVKEYALRGEWVYLLPIFLISKLTHQADRSIGYYETKIIFS